MEAILRYNPIKIFLLLAAPFLLACPLLALLAIVLEAGLPALLSLGTLSTGTILVAIGFLSVLLLRREPAHVEALPASTSLQVRDSGQGTLDSPHLVNVGSQGV